MKAEDWGQFIACSNDVPHGVIKGAQDRFWKALGDHAGAVAHRINTDPTFCEIVARLAIRHHEKTRVAAIVRERKKITATYKVADCFVGWSRDPNLDKWLPATLPVLPDGKETPSFVTTGVENTRQIVECELGVTGKGDEDLQKLLVEKRKCFSLKQIEKISAGFKVGDRGLFFFEVAGAVFVVFVYRYSVGWVVNVYRFAYSLSWRAGHRSFFRN